MPYRQLHQGLPNQTPQAQRTPMNYGTFNSFGGTQQNNASLSDMAQQRLREFLSPGFSAVSPAESDARFQAMQGRISEAFDQRSRQLAESLNQRGLYRTGLFDQLQHQYVERPRLQYLSDAARDVYLYGQDATRSLQQQALQNALWWAQFQQQAQTQQRQQDIQDRQARGSFWGGLAQLAGALLPFLL